MASRWVWYWRELKAFGFRGTLALHRAKRCLGTYPKGHHVKMPNGMIARAQTSDLEAFQPIFVKREYRCLDHVKDAKLIIDAGANVGYSAAYFLERYPDAHVVAIEPDEDNFAIMRQNLERYGKRTTLYNTGVWSKMTGLVLEPNHEEWSHQVREAAPGEHSTMTALDIGTILEKSGHERISILKIDIEGSEREVFARNHAWLSKVDHLVIEIHPLPGCHDTVYEAVQPLRPKLTEVYGELTAYSFV